MENPLARWSGKIALVTGASSGIGRAIAEDFGRLGLRVAVTGRRVDALEETCHTIRAHGAEALALPGDQTQADVNRHFFSTVRATWGPVDVLVNNAAMLGGLTLLDTDWADLQGALDLNIRAPLLCAREAVAQMRGRADTAIINISSMVGHRVMPGVPALYAATKHALRVLTDGLRAELATEVPPIKVAMLSPSLVDTPWHARADGILARKGAYPHPPLQYRDVLDALSYILSTPPGTQVCDILLRSSAQPF